MALFLGSFFLIYLSKTLKTKDLPEQFTYRANAVKPLMFFFNCLKLSSVNVNIAILS